MLGYLSADISCFEVQTVSREQTSRETVTFEEQVMSKDKYLSALTRQMEAIVYYPSDIFKQDRSISETFSEKLFNV